MRREPTEENKALFGYKRDGTLYSNCLKCRMINQKNIRKMSLLSVQAVEVIVQVI